jgi:pyridoxine kinase
MLSGYAPSAAAVEAVGAIGLDLQRKAESKPGSFFWGMFNPIFSEFPANGELTYSP